MSMLTSGAGASSASSLRLHNGHKHKPVMASSDPCRRAAADEIPFLLGHACASLGVSLRLR